MGLNTKNAIPGASPEVRQAMKYLVDYDGLAKTSFSGIGIKHQTFLPEGQLGADNETPFTFDLAKAKELLAKARPAQRLQRDHGHHQQDRGPRACRPRSRTPWPRPASTSSSSLADNKTTLTKYRASEHDIYIGQWGSDYQDPHSNAEGYLMAPLAKRNRLAAARKMKPPFSPPATRRTAPSVPRCIWTCRRCALDEQPLHHHVPAGRDRGHPAPT